MPTQLDNRQVVQRAVLPFIGNAANEALSVLFPRVDAEMAKLYEDRNIFLTDGGIITFTGTQIQFTENLNIVLNQKISGAAPQVISLGSANVNLNNGEMWYAVVNRTAGTASTSIASTLPAVVAANQEVFLIVKRVDAGDGTQRIYWRSGMAMNAGQSNRLGASGSGSGGSGVGDDLDALLFRASFRDGFDEGPTDSKSAVDVTAAHTDSAAYNAAKAMYTLNYDASKTIAAATTTTNINLSANAAFTVKTGDVVINAGQARRITAVANQASFTVEAFSVAPTLASQVTVSQAVHTKDVYNFAVDGNALSAAFSGATFSEILVDYEDTTAAGDNIFDVNVAPVVAYDASQNGTAFTDVKSRVTLETDTMQSVSLPAAGTGLYMRFYALKTSGSGIVNVLGYRAFMQKTTQGTSGGITNSAYAFTNGVGTPVNCTVGVSGGKTTITLNWSYAVGAYPAGTSASAIEVWVNGQKAPKFINATLTPDLSFLETSANVVTLDKDYSAVNISVEIFQRTQIVDNSTVNTTNISYQSEMLQNGFQAFVNQNQLMNATTTAGTPAGGTFYSSIIGRSAMVDLSQDLRPRLATDRFMVTQLGQLQNEAGANGELVSVDANDIFNQIRFVGNWTSLDNNAGKYAQTSTVNDYLEITFYGTGLNILTFPNDNSKVTSISTDGGAFAGNIYPTTESGVLLSRNVGTNTVRSVVTNLSLGIHTIALKHTAGNFQVYGFEILNEATTLKIASGSSYVGGSKLVNSVLQSVAYDSSFETGTLGSRGGRVLVYQKADGSIAKSVNPAGSQLNMTAADHSNEEMIRTYQYREFGAGTTTDFSRLTGTQATVGILDDATTTLTVTSAVIDTAVATNSEGFCIGNGQFAVFTFVGTGLDITIVDASTSTSRQITAISVDGGSSIGTIVNSGAVIPRQVRKIVSGLPYGTHTVKFTSNGGANSSAIVDFKVYGAKKPTLPSGAIELADYHILPAFVAQTDITSRNHDFVSTGVIRKNPSREMAYSGAGWATDISLTENNTAVRTPTNGDFFTYTWLGTGFEAFFRAGTGDVASVTVLLNGVNMSTANFPTSTILFTGPASTGYSAPTLDLQGSNGGARLSIKNLPFAVYTVRFTKSVAGTDPFVFHEFDIISPIHSAKSSSNSDVQNTLAIGSCGISDNRKITPIKDVSAGPKFRGVARGITANPTTTVTFANPVPDLSITAPSKGAWFKLSADILGSLSGPSNWKWQFYVDGLPYGQFYISNSLVNNQEVLASIMELVYLAPGVHKIDVYTQVGGGITGSYNGTGRILIVEET